MHADGLVHPHGEVGSDVPHPHEGDQDRQVAHEDEANGGEEGKDWKLLSEESRVDLRPDPIGMNKRFLLSLFNILGLCVVIVAVSLYFIHQTFWMGEILIALGLLCLLSLRPFGIKLKSVLADIFFGVIDNGILALMAIFGGYFGGVAGAILGGVVGNAMTDGIAGIFEGYIGEKFDNHDSSSRRTMLKSAVGKMAGCLLGAGVILSIASLL